MLSLEATRQNPKQQTNKNHMKTNIRNVFIANKPGTQTSCFRGGISPLAMAAALMASLCAQAQNTQTADFDSLPYGTTGTALQSYLAGYGMTITGMGAGTVAEVYDDRIVYGGGVLLASSGHMYFYLGGAHTGVSCTLTFDPPLTSLSFTRITELAKGSGTAYPDWSATVYEGATVNGSVGESAYSLWGSNVNPAKTYTFLGSRITSVTFYGNGHNFAAFDGPFIDDIVVTRSQTDLVAKSLTWDSTSGGVNFQYEVRSNTLTTATTAKLFWASGTTAATIIPGAPTIFTQPIPVGASGLSAVINVPGQLLINPPVGTTTLLLVVNPDNLVAEVNTNNNLISLPDVTLTFGNAARDAGRVSAASTDILKNLLRYAGQSTATITSVARTPEQQGQIMFNKAYKGTTQNYKAPGQAVLAVYAAQTAGLTKAQILANETSIVAAMVSEIYRQGPGNVSHHCADPNTLNVVDIWQGNFPSSAQILFVQDALNTSAISRFLGPFSLPGFPVAYDSVFHLEIPQTSHQSQPTPSDIGALLAFTNGQAFATGTVSTTTNEFTFYASAGDTITIGVSVTAFRLGTVFDDDDSMIFLLDSRNRLIASNDDDIDGGFQSVIAGLTVTNSDWYTVAVTTFGELPVVDTNGIVTSWNNGGESDIDFALYAYVQPALIGPLISRISSGNIVISWTNGVIQQTTNLVGPWVDLPYAITPLTNSGSSSMMFYRLRRQ